MDFWREFQGPNSGYVLELYDRYLDDPQSVDEETRRFFDSWQPPAEPAPASGAAPPAGAEAAPASQETLAKAVAVANLAQAVRSYGHLAARLDPLGSEPPGDPELDPGFHGLSEADLASLPASLVGGPVVAGSANALEAIEALRRIYTGKMGYDYGHVVDPEERDWLREAAESRRFCVLGSQEDPLALLDRLTSVEAFERFLHRTFPGKTRFSIEGLDMMVPVLDHIIHAAADDEVCMVFLGMAHRGRLNVLAHILHRPYEQILAEFKDPGGDDKSWQELGWTGDVKYHRGGKRTLGEGEDVRIVICMPPNPSHLEFINPVVEGMARSADTVSNRPGEPLFYPKASLPVLIHGDAAFPAEGIAAETLNFSHIQGYSTAGTIHIIANNQLGFTTLPEEGRSSLYASDFAKGLKIPVLHVNADDPDACLEAACTAYQYRSSFHKDFLIDLVGYRRYGHNEGDEPGFTQPRMYALIEEHPTARDLLVAALQKQELITAEDAKRQMDERMQELQRTFESVKLEESRDETIPAPPPRGAARQVPTAVPLERLESLLESLLQAPEGFNLNKKLERPRRRRAAMFDNPNQPAVDWAAAEDLAFASILEDGCPIRLTGQDTERGTFNQRHAVLFDTETGESFSPLQALPQAKASFEVYNSPLSEAGAVGFEFGYSIQSPDRMVIWEAQYGDFVNAAQAHIDEFVLSARAKWGQTPSLVMLLPHGNEGQGPDHTSARPERFLELAAENNFRLAYPTTAAQYFHLLRRHAALLKVDPLPMVVLTPKGLLRHPLTASRPIDLAQGMWMRLIPDERQDTGEVRRLALCSGRVYVDLVSDPRRPEVTDLAITRLEQLYPFYEDEIRKEIERYPNLEEVMWVQEEPQNMGFWNFLRPRLLELIGERAPLHYVGRMPSSSPAEGSLAWYQRNQKALVSQVFETDRSIWEKGIVIERRAV